MGTNEKKAEYIEEPRLDTSYLTDEYMNEIMKISSNPEFLEREITPYTYHKLQTPGEKNK